MSDHYVIGRNSVREVLKSCPQRINKLLACTSDSNQLLSEILSEASHNKIAVEERTKEELEKLVNSTSHQSVAAQMVASPVLDIKSAKSTLTDPGNKLVIALDGVEDPHNLGAIIRAAECFQASAVLWSSNRGTGLTPTVTKVSSGASELVPLINCKNLRNALEKLRDWGFWTVATTISDASQSLHQFEFPEKTVLVIGAEHKGVSSLVVKESDFQLMIPMHGRIDSLNVSQSVACLLSAWRAQIST